MDHSKRPSDKTYSELMNEWSAQKNFVKGSRSRLLHPPYDAHPGLKFLGYLGRILLVIIIPTVVYVHLLQKHGKSEDLNEQLSAGIAELTEAANTEVTGSHWKIDGMLSIQEIDAKGNPDAFYESFNARKIGTRIPIPAVFRKQWILPRVSLQELEIALRSGGRGEMPLYDPTPGDEIDLPSLESKELLDPLPKTGSVPPKKPLVLAAGFGINPDFATLQINSLQIARLKATWGTSPASSGSLSGLQTDLTRGPGEWILSGNNGKFQQGWLDEMNIGKLALAIAPGKVLINEASLSRQGGATGNLTGTILLGEFPEVDATLTLENLLLHDLVNPTLGSLFTAEGGGTLKLSGSLNRSTGIQIEGTINLASGKITAIPVLKALHILTTEEQFRLLSIRTGSAELISGGSAEHGGQVIEIKSFEADCGPVARLKGNYRQETIRRSASLSEIDDGQQIKVSGSIQLGISPHIVNSLKPAIVAEFLKSGENGWFWMDIPITAPLDADFSQEISGRMLQADAAAAP